MSNLRVWVADGGASSTGVGNHLGVNVTPGSRWATYRFLTRMPNPAATLYMTFARATGATGTTVKVGRARAYHSREPVISDLAVAGATTTTTAPSAGAAAALPATPAGYLTVSINGTARRIAYY